MTNPCDTCVFAPAYGIDCEECAGVIDEDSATNQQETHGNNINDSRARTPGQAEAESLTELHVITVSPAREQAIAPPKERRQEPLAYEGRRQLAEERADLRATAPDGANVELRGQNRRRSSGLSASVHAEGEGFAARSSSHQEAAAAHAPGRLTNFRTGDDSPECGENIAADACRGNRRNMRQHGEARSCLTAPPDSGLGKWSSRGRARRFSGRRIRVNPEQGTGWAGNRSRSGQPGMFPARTAEHACAACWCDSSTPHSFQATQSPPLETPRHDCPSRRLGGRFASEVTP